MATRRPAYVDARVPEPELRAMHRIAAKRERLFSRAFMSVTRSLFTAEAKQRMLEALRREDIDGAVEAIEWFNPADPSSRAIWAVLGINLERVIMDVAVDAGADTARRVDSNLAFVSKQTILDPAIFTERFARDRAATLVIEISETSRAALRELIADNIIAGIRPAEILRQIEMLVGLTSREIRAVRRRMQLALDEGIPQEVAERNADVHAGRLLRGRARRIARTETFMAASQGRLHAWQLAQESGFLAPTAVREWVAIMASGRTCPICIGLDGDRVSLDGFYVSEIIGQVRAPPAHPNCRCTEVIRFVGDDEPATPPVELPGFVTEGSPPVVELG